MQNLSGQYIGRYHVVELLGEGGLANVYKAYDSQLERFVAIKIIRIDAFPSSTRERVLIRFDREARSLAQMSHPNIVKIYDHGQYEGAPFLVMEYLSGGTLKELLTSPFEWEKAVNLVLPIASALNYAHKMGVLHRDVKPANIMLSSTGQPILSDFGIAKLIGDQSEKSLTGTGVGIGTPEYMSPEQWTGKDLDSRTDVYSLGVVLYEMITGQTPFNGDTTPQVMFKVLQEPVPKLRSFQKDVPQQVEKVIHKALARMCDNRFQDMENFAHELEQLSGLTGKKAVIKYKGYSPKMTFVFIGMIILILLGGIFFFTIQNRFSQIETSKILGKLPPQLNGTLPPEPSITSTFAAVTSPQTLDIAWNEQGGVPITGKYHWEFSNDSDLEGWGEQEINQLDNQVVKNGLLFLHSTNENSYISAPQPITIDSTVYKKIYLRMKVSSGYYGRIYFITDKDGVYNDSKRIDIPIIDNKRYYVYQVNMGLHEKWTGNIVGIRFQSADRVDSTIFIDYFRMVEENKIWEQQNSAEYWSTIYKKVVNNSEELLFDDFSSVNNRRWWGTNGNNNIYSTNGNIILVGRKEIFTEMFNSQKLSWNEGILAKFQFSELVDGQIRFFSQYPNMYPAFGLGFNQNGFLAIKQYGKEFIQDNNLIGDTKFSPDKWFNILLFNSDIDCMYLRVWDSENPESFAEYVFPLESDVINRRWSVTIFAQQGELLLDWYKEIHY